MTSATYASSAPFVSAVPTTSTETIRRSTPIRLAADALDGNALCWEHLVLQRVHRRRRLVDVSREGDRAGEDRLQERTLLDAGRTVLVLDDQRRRGRVEVEQLAGRQLVVEPVDAAVLQVGQRVVPGRAGKLVLTQHDLLLPGVGEV